jgi:hypothetical protein
MPCAFTGMEGNFSAKRHFVTAITSVLSVAVNPEMPHRGWIRQWSSTCEKQRLKAASSSNHVCIFISNKRKSKDCKKDNEYKKGEEEGK